MLGLAQCLALLPRHSKALGTQLLLISLPTTPAASSFYTSSDRNQVVAVRRCSGAQRPRNEADRTCSSSVSASFTPGRSTEMLLILDRACVGVHAQGWCMWSNKQHHACMCDHSPA